MTKDITALKQQLAKLQELHRDGVLDDAAFEHGKATVERKILDAVMGNPETADATHALAQKVSNKLIAGIVLAMLVVAAAGYWWNRSTSLNGQDAGPAAAAAEGDTGTKPPHATNFDQIASMAERLAARMKDQPNDAEGWAMLARSYSVLGRHPEALVAYEKAVALRKDDPVLLSDYADSLAVKQDRKLAGAPMLQVERALKLDPRNIKALSLAGSDAFERKDYKGAIKFWEKATSIGPSDNPIVQQLQGSLEDARTRSGIVAPAASQPQPGVPAATGSVSGTVTLASALKGKVQPDDTVFVFARAASGSRMPLALLRRQVKDLPLNFTLDDSMGMAPSSKLTDVQQVIVGARISKSGNAVPQPGDLSGQTGTVAVGASSVKLEINEQVAR